MPREIRTFEDFDAKATKVAKALLVGITSPSGAGKTFSALRLATGMQRITGGEIFGVDTEKNRMRNYDDKFAFRHVPFNPPYNPLAYVDAINHCLKKGAKIIIVDSMSHEHAGDGGVLDMIDEYLSMKVARKKPHEDEDGVRERYKWSAQIEPKAERRRLNEMVRQIGAQAIMIFCYRADDKTKPVSGGKPVHVGWQAETTSKLPYDMTVRFLLPPGSDGHPNLNPDTEFEKLSVKMPETFRDWFKPGLQLNEELGERLARWSIGETAAKPEPPKKRDPVAGLNAILALGNWPDAEARILATLTHNHRSELTEDDAKTMAEAWKKLKPNPALFDDIFPALPAPGSDG